MLIKKILFLILKKGQVIWVYSYKNSKYKKTMKILIINRFKPIDQLLV
jgi:hypothetical protein